MAQNTESAVSDILDIEGLESAVARTDPFPYFYLERSANPGYVQRLIADFPQLNKGGSFNIDEVPRSNLTHRFVDQFDSERVRAILGDKLNVDLKGKPMMTTLRGYSRAKDGSIHTDSKAKLVTVLVYMNQDWEPATGRLRILRGSTDMDDYTEEFLPGASSMVAFKVTDNCWHGYRSFEGKRQSIQINFLASENARTRFGFFHGLSSRLKRLS
jgi:2OG-Fe(II) oxygenase superfamily